MNRVGGMLGLLMQGRNTKIFISYRATDGTAIANQLYDHLQSIGHQVFLDEAKEIDGYTKILPGNPVQNDIDDALEKSNLLLLIDTPAAPDSRWMVREVETAGSLLLPILPLCFRDKNDPKQGPRFRSLLALQRWVPFERPGGTTRRPLSAEQLDKIVVEAEKYLCEIFQRKCRVPFLVEKEFVSRGFAWSVLDQRLLMFTSSKGGNWRVSTKVLSHCSLFDPSYGPAMKRFSSYLKEARRHNYSLFLYDGELLPEPELQQLVDEKEGDAIFILHHQELAALIDSNFTILPGAA